MFSLQIELMKDEKNHSSSKKLYAFVVEAVKQLKS